MSLANLNLFETDPDKFLLRFVTMDETVVQYFTPESSLNNGITLAHPAKEDKVWFDNWEGYGLIFWDADGMVDYLQKDTSCDWKVKVKYKSVSIYVFIFTTTSTHTFQMHEGVHGHVQGSYM